MNISVFTKLPRAIGVRWLTIIARPKRALVHPSLAKVKNQDAYVDDSTDAVYTKNTFPHPQFSQKEMQAIEVTHRPTTGLRDVWASWLVQLLRFGFDVATGYRVPKKGVVATKDNYDLSPEKWLSRFIFLESIAGVPGMVASFIRHLHSLRLMKRDRAWIETLCDEAYNERMHLLTFVQIGKPGLITRAFLVVAQGVFVNMFFFSYLFTPKTCHRFVGYLEEEAVRTYTHCLGDLERGLLPELEALQVPDIALAYWNMKPDASFKDLIYYVRADEAKHREVNHTLANMRSTDRNPYAYVADESVPQPTNDFKHSKPTGWLRDEIAKVSEK